MTDHGDMVTIRVPEHVKLALMDFSGLPEMESAVMRLRKRPLPEAPWLEKALEMRLAGHARNIQIETEWLDKWFEFVVDSYLPRRDGITLSADAADGILADLEGLPNRAEMVISVRMLPAVYVHEGVIHALPEMAKPYLHQHYAKTYSIAEHGGEIRPDAQFTPSDLYTYEFSRLGYQFVVKTLDGIIDSALVTALVDEVRDAILTGKAQRRVE